MGTDLIIYDLDGTLIDSLEDIAASVNRTLTRFGLPPLEKDLVRQNVGMGARRLIRAIADKAKGLKTDTRSINFDDLFATFLDDYGRHLLDTTTLYPGVRKTLEHFRHKQQAVISNKPTALSEKILKGLGIADSFVRIWGSESAPQLKPAPDAILALIKELGGTPDRTVIVGDSPVDIEAGKNAGIATVGVTYGLRDREELIRARPMHLINSISELITLFQ